MRRFWVTYYKISASNLERLETFMAASGDNERTLIMQYVRGWIGRNRDYYMALAVQDAEARGLSFAEWGRQIVDGKLPGDRCLFCELTDPLPHTPLHPAVVRRRLNYVNLTTQNVALLKIGQHYAFDRVQEKPLTMIEFLSRIVQTHLDRNWDPLCPTDQS